MSGHAFFFYGSLMDLELLEAVIDRSSDHLRHQPGRLDGYAAETAHGYSFPTLVARRGAVVKGVVTHGLSDADIERISYFEDTEYAHHPVEVVTAAATITARTYMSTSTLRSSGEAWDFEQWQVQHKPVLVAVTRKVMGEHYGITPFEEIDAHWHRIKSEIEAEMALGRRRG
ncbi:MAG: gamma-glutamylcyclotransferase family protein [Alphaproteobacteria bacterium]